MRRDKSGNIAIGAAIVTFVFVFLFFAFQIKVPVGYSAISVDLYGKDVEPKGLHTGRNFVNPITHDFYMFPVFIQQTEYEDLTFQDEDGLVITSTIGMDYKFNEAMIGSLYYEYRASADKITNVYMRTWVKNAVNRTSSKYKVDVLYGIDKEKFRLDVLAALKEDLTEKGINVNNVYFAGQMELPKQVMSRISAKIEATQKAMQKENELRSVEADAQKKIAEAKGVAISEVEKAKGLAEARIIEAESIADANKLINSSLTKMLIDSRKIETWNGALPQVTGGATPFINLK